MNNENKGVLSIKKEHIEKFKEIINKFSKNTEIPKFGNWKKQSDKDIWERIFEQVIIVGDSDSYDRFHSKENREIKEKVSYARLKGMSDENDIRKTIYEALRDLGVRYAGKDIKKCKKTQALTNIILWLKKNRKTPKSLLVDISKKKSDDEKIDYLRKTFKGMYLGGEKSSRDFLIGLGLIKNSIAFDVRISNIFKKIGIKLPKNMEKYYKKVEEEVLEKICKPLNITGTQFDRILYNNYDDILEYL
ncbi:MAG: hypothetical protein N2746_12650 [Deltaproteobacteria bacterium]|nr:hypothetical protein [Deltaproteobacteria bacterium]